MADSAIRPVGRHRSVRRRPTGATPWAAPTASGRGRLGTCIGPALHSIADPRCSSRSPWSAGRPCQPKRGNENVARAVRSSGATGPAWPLPPAACEQSVASVTRMLESDVPAVNVTMTLSCRFR